MSDPEFDERAICEIVESNREPKDEESYMPFTTGASIASPQYVPREIRRDLFKEFPVRIVNESMPTDSPLHTNGNTAGVGYYLLRVFAPDLWKRHPCSPSCEPVISLPDGVANDAQLNTLLWWMREWMEDGLDWMEDGLDVSNDEEMDTDDEGMDTDDEKMDTDDDNNDENNDDADDATEQSDWQDDGMSSTNFYLYPPLPPLFTHPLDPPRTAKWIDWNPCPRLLSQPPVSESITVTLLPLLGTTVALGINSARNEIVDIIRDLVRERPLRAEELEALIRCLEPKNKHLHRIFSCIGERFSRRRVLGGDERAFLLEHCELLEIVLHVAEFERIVNEKSYLSRLKHGEDLDTIVREARDEKILGWLQGLPEEQEEHEVW